MTADTNLALDWEIWPFEAGLCIMFLSGVVSELLQFYILRGSYWGTPHSELSLLCIRDRRNQNPSMLGLTTNSESPRVQC